MLKFATNIMFILIIFVLATALPLSTDILTLNLAQPIIENPDDTPVAILSDVTIDSTSDYLISDGAFSFSLTSSTEQFPEEILGHFDLQLQGNKSDSLTFELSELAEMLPQTIASVREYTVDLNPIVEKLPNDYYLIQIVSDKDFAQTQKNEDLQFLISTYDFDFKYSGTSHSLPSGLMGMTIYFPTPDYEMLVPITRSLTRPDNRWRNLFTQLENGSKPSLGLIEGEQVIPHSPRIRISKGIANVYFYDQSLAGFEDKFPIITHSIAKSMLSMGYISGVNFLVNDIDTGTYGDVDLSKSYTYDNTINSFVGYSSDSEYAFLMPIEKIISPDMLQSDQIETLWNTIKFTDTETKYGDNWIQIVPPQLEMIDYIVDGELITLNFNDTFNTLISADSVHSDLLIDSLVYTFTSIPEINRIKIVVDGQAPSSPELATELIPAPYINMEP